MSLTATDTPGIRIAWDPDICPVLDVRGPAASRSEVLDGIAAGVLATGGRIQVIDVVAARRRQPRPVGHPVPVGVKKATDVVVDALDLIEARRTMPGTYRHVVIIDNLSALARGGGTAVHGFDAMLSTLIGACERSGVHVVASVTDDLERRLPMTWFALRSARKIRIPDTAVLDATLSGDLRRDGLPHQRRAVVARAGR